MCRSRLTALRPEPRRELQAPVEGFTQEHIAAQFTEPWCSATIRAIPSMWARIDIAPHISLHPPAAATTYHLSITRHLTTTVSVRSEFAAEESGEQGWSRRDEENLVAVVAATIVAGLLAVSPADARPKKQKRPDPQRRYEVQTQTPSLDGRITGQTRTCWFETLQYDGLGVPYGPYCH